MLAGVHVEHEVDEGALQFGAHVPIQGEAGAGDFGGAFQVQDAEFRPQVPMRFGGEIVGAGLAHAAHFHVVVGVLAHRHGFVRDVGDAGQQILKLGVDALHLLVQGCDLRLQHADLLPLCRSVLALPQQRSDFGACLIDGRLQLLGLRDGGTAALVQVAELLEARRIAARCEPFGHPVEIVPEV